MHPCDQAQAVGVPPGDKICLEPAELSFVLMSKMKSSSRNAAAWLKSRRLETGGVITACPSRPDLAQKSLTRKYARCQLRASDLSLLEAQIGVEGSRVNEVAYLCHNPELTFSDGRFNPSAGNPYHSVSGVERAVAGTYLAERRSERELRQESGRHIYLKFYLTAASDVSFVLWVLDPEPLACRESRSLSQDVSHHYRASNAPTSLGWSISITFSRTYEPLQRV
jgi:hypothetical protein